jgi:uncharacterized protein (TIGR03067 family)
MAAAGRGLAVLAAVVLGVAVVVAARAGSPKPAPSAAKLIGEWELTESEMRGSVPEVWALMYTFEKGGAFVSRGPGRPKNGRWKISGKGSPRPLDFTEDGAAYETNFEVKGDALTLAFTERAGAPRPKSFADAEVKMTFRRVKK